MLIKKIQQEPTVLSDHSSNPNDATNVGDDNSLIK